MPARKKASKPRKNAMSKEKKEKLDIFLRDFDCEVEAVMERMQERKKQLLKDADNAYNILLIKTPPAVREMNWLEHWRQCINKGKSPPAVNPAAKEEAAIVQSVLTEVQTVIPKSVKKPSSKGVENTAPKTTKKGKVAKKPPTTSKRAKAVAAAQLNTSVRQSSRKKPLITPARNMLDMNMLGTTPLVTPRFDPRLPYTPGVRTARPQERTYTISANGSPLAMSNFFINVPTGNGESVQLLADQMDTLDLAQLDAVALKDLRQLQSRLTALCGPPV